MKSVAYKAYGGRGGLAHLTIGPANRNKQGKFGALDAAIIATLLLVTAAVVSLVLIK